MNLTPRALWICALIAVVGIAGQWSVDGLFTSLWRYPTAALLAALLYEGLVARQHPLGVRLRLPETGHLGRRHTMTVAFTNPTARVTGARWKLLPPTGVTLDEPGASAEVQPGAALESPVQFVANRLGTSEWPGLALRLRGVLGLAEWSRRMQRPERFEVLPDTLYQGASRRAGERFGSVPVSRSGGGSELLELRDYRPGDALRSIDWKATARVQKLTVREMTEEQHLEIVIAVDIGRTSARRAGALTELGHQVNLAARLAEYAIAQDDRVGLVVYAGEPVVTVPPASGLPAVVRIRAALRGLQPRPEESNPLSAVMHIRRLIKLRSLVVMPVDLEDTDGTGQLVASTRLLMPKHLPMLVSIVDTDIESLATQRADNWIDPYVSLAALDTRDNIESNARRLRQLGARIVRARPLEIDNAVLATYAELRRRHRV